MSHPFHREAPSGDRRRRLSRMGMIWQVLRGLVLLDLRVYRFRPHETTAGQRGVTRCSAVSDHAGERVDAADQVVDEREVGLSDGGDGRRGLHGETAAAGADLGDDLTGHPGPRLARREVEAGRGRLVAGVDVELVDLEVGELSEPHEAPSPRTTSAAPPLPVRTRSPSLSRAPFWSAWAAVWPFGTTSAGARARITWAVPVWAPAGAAGARTAAHAATARVSHRVTLLMTMPPAFGPSSRRDRRCRRPGACP